MVCVDAFVSDWCKPPRCQDEKRGELREVSIVFDLFDSCRKDGKD